MYKPLPKQVTIKKSSIHGLGLYCVHPIDAETNLGLSHFYFENQLMRTPLGAFYNHKESPFANVVKHKEGNRFYLIALRDIWPGEEITCEYTFYSL